jgi:hypothetical protein
MLILAHDISRKIYNKTFNEKSLQVSSERTNVSNRELGITAP